MAIRTLAIDPFELPGGANPETIVTISLVDENNQRIQGLVASDGQPIIDLFETVVTTSTVYVDLWPQPDLAVVLGYGSDADASNSYYLTRLRNRSTRFDYQFRTQVATGGALTWAEFASGTDTPEPGPIIRKDEFVAVTDQDTTPGHLQEKLQSGDSSVAFTIINPGGDEKLDLQATGQGGGEANIGQNVGAATEVFRDKTGIALNFRTISDTATVQATQNADTVTLDVPAGQFDPAGSASAVQSNLDAHEGTITGNPHAVTKADVGLGNADDTSDLDKPISTSTQAALDLKADDADLASHTGDSGIHVPPLGITNQVLTKSSGASGDTEWADPPSGGEVNLGANVGTGTPVYRNKTGVTLNFYRIDSTATVVSSLAADTISLNVPAGQFDPDGSADAVQSNLDTHIGDGTLHVPPGGIANQVLAKIDAVDGNTEWQDPLEGSTDEKTKVSVADTTAKFLNDAVISGDASVSFSIINPGANEQLDIRATGAGGGESNEGANVGTGVDVFRDKSGVVLNFHRLGSTATVVPSLATNTISFNVPAGQFDPDGSAAAVQTNLDAHEADQTNPHVVTKGQVGLSNVDNTSDLAKPISTSTQAALDLKADDSALTAHTGNGGIHVPALGTTGQVLAKASDTSGDTTWNDAGENNSGANVGTGVGVFRDKTGVTLNFHNLGSTATVVPSLAADTISFNVPAGQFDPDGSAAAVQSNLDTHTGTVTGNPHGVTQADVGLGNVDNTSDLNKPISISTQAALDLKLDQDSDVRGLLLGGDLRTRDNQIVLSTGADLKLGLVAGGIGLEGDYVTLAKTDANGNFDLNNGSFAALYGQAHIYGAAVKLGVFEEAAAGNRQVYVNEDGNLYAVNPPAAGWSETDTDTGDYDLGTGTGPQPWVEMTGLLIAVPQDVAVGERVDVYTNINVVNKTGNRSGTIDIGFGIDGVAPTSGQNFSVPPGFDGYIAANVSTTTHGGLTTGQTITVFARVFSGSHGSFGADLIGSAGDDHELIVSVPSGGGAGEANTGANVGTGVDVYRNKVGDVLNFHRIGDTATVEASLGTDTISLNVPAGQFDPAGSASTVQGNLDTHTADQTNPHVVTKAQVGLGNCDNTSDLNKPISTATQTALDLKPESVDLDNIVVLTQSEYDALTPDARTFYLING